MQRAIDAIYENGMFRPVRRERLAITEGKRVRITVDDEGDPEALRLAVSVYDGLSDGEGSAKAAVRHFPVTIIHRTHHDNLSR